MCFTENKLRVVDGPFAESKELLGEFLTMELANAAEAIEVCRRYAAIQGGTFEVDLREVDTKPAPA